MLTSAPLNQAVPVRATRALRAILLACLGLAALCGPAHGAESDQGLDLKYMYYWDRNGVWNHTPAFAFFRKLGNRWKFQWDQELDYVSGASRRLGLKNIGRLADNDQNLDAVSGASRREFRHSEQPSISYSNQGRNAAAAFYFSDENDYTSYSPSLSGSLDFNERNTTVGGSAAAFFDDMHPAAPFAGLGGSRTILSLSATLAQLLSPLTLIGATANVIHSSGFLGHPYTPAITGQGDLLLENLPDKKTAASLTGQIVQGYHLGDHLGSIHFEARHYRDDWRLVSNTADLQWYQYLLEGTYVRLRVRGYRQGAAAFAKDRYDGDEVYRTPDIRYFAFSSLTLGAKIGSTFPESWGGSAWLPDRWDLSYDHGVRDTRGEDDGIHPLYHYQLFPADEHYIQGTFMAGLSFDL